MRLCVLTIVDVLVIGVLVFTVFCIVGNVFLYYFVYTLSLIGGSVVAVPLTGHQDLQT